MWRMTVFTLFFRCFGCKFWICWLCSKTKIHGLRASLSIYHLISNARSWHNPFQRLFKLVTSLSHQNISKLKHSWETAGKVKAKGQLEVSVNQRQWMLLRSKQRVVVSMLCYLISVVPFLKLERRWSWKAYQFFNASFLFLTFKWALLRRWEIYLERANLDRTKY